MQDYLFLMSGYQHLLWSYHKIHLVQKFLEMDSIRLRSTMAAVAAAADEDPTRESLSTSSRSLNV
jgi:hypothetical protein